MLRTILAAVLLSVLGSAGAQEFLSPEEAFQVEVESATAEAVTLRWTIASGYYLYRKETAVATPDGSPVGLGEPELPAGEVKEDPYFGTTQVYYDGFSARVPVQGSGGLPESFDIEIRHQGCADGGICYPPQTQTLTVSPEGGGGAAAAAGATGGPAETATPAAAPEAPEQDRLAALLAGGELSWILAAFFAAGLLLSFSPCMLPMLPILSSVIVGSEGGGGRYRGLLLSVAYVLPMALGYAALGTAAGLAGANLQAWLQSPWILVPFAGLFVLLALAMLGFYELQLPAALQSRLLALSSRQRGGHLLGVAVMGLLSALIVGPCMTAPLAGALLYIGQTGDAVLGGLALLVLGLGMGLPLIVVGAVGGRFLPKAGPWMSRIQVVFGFVLLGVAVWMLERVLPAPAVVALWGLLLAGVAVVLGALEPIPEGAGPGRRLGKVLGLGAALWGAVLVVGAAAGANDPLRPLAVLAGSGSAPPEAAAAAEDYVSLEGLQAVQAELEEARAAGEPVVVDFYADWCISCKVIEERVFGDPEVRQAMAGVRRLRPDVTDNGPDDRALLSEYEVAGPPTLMFIDTDGREHRDQRIVGEIGPREFLDRLERSFEGS